MIGNIVTSNDLKVDENFNVVDSLDNIIEGIPTLLVGIDNAKKKSDKLNYIERQLDDNTFWTFTKKEKRVLFEEDLFYFIENSYKHLTEKINYVFVDAILFDNTKMKGIFDEISKNDNNITFITNEMVYIYCGDKIFGIDLKQIKYVGGDIVKLMGKIKDWSKVFLENDEILIEYKNNLGMVDDEVKYIPVLYSIRENG
jgi:hypothetical protein